MRYSTRRLRNLRLGLKEAEPGFRNILVNGKPILENGRPYRNFGRMLPRELAANWLVAAVLDHCTRSGRFQIMSDPAGGDGLIVDSVTEHALWTEHVMVIDRARVPVSSGDPHSRILESVAAKNNRDSTYWPARHLVIFLYRTGNPRPWWPNRLARLLPRPLNFETVWLVGFQRFEGGDRIYAVTCLDVSQGHAPIWFVRIASDFDRWAVCDIQAAGGGRQSSWNYNSGFLVPSAEEPIAILRPARAIRAPSLGQIALYSNQISRNER